MSASTRLSRIIAVGFVVAALLGANVASAQAQMDPANPTCPLNPNWSDHRQMQFTVQEVDGRTILLAEGQIDNDLIPRLEEALRNFDGDEMRLRSPGGNFGVGLEAGRIIRASGLSTHIPTGWTCFSACNYMFMGGVDRSVESGGVYMIHMPGGSDAEVSPGLANEIAQFSALIASVETDFLIRMGVSRRLLTEIVYQERSLTDGRNSSMRRCLTQDEMREYRVVSPPPPLRSR